MNPIIKALSAMGKSSCIEIAARLKRDVRETLKELEVMRDRNQVTFLNGYWSVPGAASATESAVLVEPAESVKTTAELIADIPAFTSRAADLIVPTSAGIARELRRARARVASLEKLRDTTKQFRRHAKLLQELEQ